MAQKSITSFFKPSNAPNMKRSLANQSPVASASKKAKSSPVKGAGIAEAENVAPNPELAAEILHMSPQVSALHPTIGQSWYCALKDEFSKPYFKKLSSFLAAERKAHTVYPNEKDVFSWTQHCPVDDVKVVILGQDPYHGPNQAHGLCFSVMPTVPPPPSLKNMYKELASDIEGFKEPGHGYLVGWATQGVLLLNAVLTVRASSANSHKDRGWEQFTSAVIAAVAKHNKGVVFLLWGAYAQKKVAHIDKSDHHLLSTVHPSPLSAHRGFLGCRHFSKCNELLQEQGKTPIDWTHLPL